MFLWQGPFLRVHYDLSSEWRGHPNAFLHVSSMLFSQPTNRRCETSVGCVFGSWVYSCLFAINHCYHIVLIMFGLYKSLWTLSNKRRKSASSWIWSPQIWWLIVGLSERVPQSGWWKKKTCFLVTWPQYLRVYTLLTDATQYHHILYWSHYPSAQTWAQWWTHSESESNMAMENSRLINDFLWNPAWGFSFATLDEQRVYSIPALVGFHAIFSSGSNGFCWVVFKVPTTFHCSSIASCRQDDLRFCELC